MYSIAYAGNHPAADITREGGETGKIIFQTARVAAMVFGGDHGALCLMRQTWSISAIGTPFQLGTGVRPVAGSLTFRPSGFRDLRIAATE